MATSARALDGGVRTLLVSLGVGSATVAPAVLGGLVAGLYAVVASVSYPSLIFSGELAAYQATGIGMALLGTVILATVMALTSSFPGTVAAAQAEPAVVLGVMAGSVTAGLGGAAASGAALLPTVVVLIVLSAAALGLVLLLLGTFGLANLIRFVPYPVIGGFLAGIGWLVFQGGFSALTARPLRPENLAHMAEAETLIRWVPGMGLACVLWALQRWRRHYLNLPALVVVAILAVWTAAWLAGASAADLRAGRWLLGPFPEGGLWTPLPHVAALGDADWGIVLRQAPQIGTLVVISLITVLLGASGLELAVRRDIDLNRELSAVGAGNLLSAFGGGFAGYHSLSASTLAARVGGRPVRLVGLVVALLCLLTLA
ncbi:MAG TPA: SulP family inorganic anion transporter, partial [Geminicoccaceae bacterium]|nr:SulP family inorganic anion transporter [Geminicoccaceae bacterium]